MNLHINILSRILEVFVYPELKRRVFVKAFCLECEGKELLLKPTPYTIYWINHFQLIDWENRWVYMRNNISSVSFCSKKALNFIIVFIGRVAGKG